MLGEGGGAGGRGWRQPLPFRRYPSHRDTCIALWSPCDPLGMREGPSCSGATSAVLMGCPFSVPGHTRGTIPGHGAPPHPSLPRRCSCFPGTSPERQRSPREEVGTLASHSGHRELTHGEPGWPSLTEQVGALSWSGRNHTPEQRDPPQEQRGAPCLLRGDTLTEQMGCSWERPTGKGVLSQSR